MPKTTASVAGEAMPEPDPIYQAILNLRSTELRVSKSLRRLTDVEELHGGSETHPACVTAKAALDRADDEFQSAQVAFLRCEPTTIAGIARAMEFAAESSFSDWDSDGGTPVLVLALESVSEEIRHAAGKFFGMLADTLRELDKLQRAGVL